MFKFKTSLVSTEHTFFKSFPKKVTSTSLEISLIFRDISIMWKRNCCNGHWALYRAKAITTRNGWTAVEMCYVIIRSSQKLHLYCNQILVAMLYGHHLHNYVILPIMYSPMTCKVGWGILRLACNVGRRTF